LLAQSGDSPVHKIILVDNNSSDDTRRVVEGYAYSTARPVRYVFEPGQGLAPARNAGIAAAGADIIAFTDDDVSARVAEVVQ
jgi:glycosyltransferase involved in cell wall biosynthesis